MLKTLTVTVEVIRKFFTFKPPLVILGVGGITLVEGKKTLPDKAEAIRPLAVGF